jgi:hypothetical protein
MELQISLSGGIRRNFPDAFSGILAPLPPVELTVEFIVLLGAERDLYDGTWPIVAMPEGWHMDSAAFRLVFSGLRSSNGVDVAQARPRDIIFDEFCGAITTALPGRNVSLSRGPDSLKPYIARLP